MLKIVGDTCFSDGDFDQGFGIGHKVKSKQNPFVNININASDFWIGNLECVISDNTNAKVNLNTFRIESKYFFNSPHLDLYSVANNHIMQHGSDAFESTLNNVSEVSSYVGSKDKKHVIIEHEGQTYGILSFSLRHEVFFSPPLYWCNPEYSDIEREYNRIKSANCKIAFIHWGNEFINYPNSEQKRQAHWLIDIGFDLVVGAHPHILQGFEKYKDKYIFYSIGNFLFNMSAPSTKYSIILNVSFQEKISISYDYLYLKEGLPEIVSKDNVPLEFTLEYLNSHISLNEDNETYYRKMFRELLKYQRINRKWILKTLHKHKFRELTYLLFSFYKRVVSK
jgi:hypothetical protein